MRLCINGGEMVIYHKSVVAGYIKYVWLDKTAITNIFSLKNVIHQYRVTYDSLDQMFFFIARKTTISTCTLEFMRVVSTTITQLNIIPS